MNSIDSGLPAPQIVELRGSDRWQIYHRLQELEIACRCAAHQPLKVEVRDSQAAIQLWSVVRQVTTPHPELRRWLEGCWYAENY